VLRCHTARASVPQGCWQQSAERACDLRPQDSAYQIRLLFAMADRSVIAPVFKERALNQDRALDRSQGWLQKRKIGIETQRRLGRSPGQPNTLKSFCLLRHHRALNHSWREIARPGSSAGFCLKLILGMRWANCEPRQCYLFCANLAQRIRANWAGFRELESPGKP